MTDVMMEFECQHLHKSYRTGKALMTVLEDLNFRVDTQEFVSLVGPSGCGKTTLLKIIADLVPPTSGHIRFSTAADNGQPRSAVVFQEHGLLPWLSILENVAFGLEMQKVKKQERRRQAIRRPHQQPLLQQLHGLQTGDLRPRPAQRLALLV